MDIFRNERRRIMKVIDILNKNGLDIPSIKKWREFIKIKCVERVPTIEKVTVKKIKSIFSEKEIKTFQKEYLYMINNYLKEVHSWLNLDKANKVIMREKAKKFVDNANFRNNGFIMFIKENIFDIDINKSEEEIVNILLLQWYDLKPEVRNIYRKMAKYHRKRYKPGKYTSLKDRIINNYKDIDICWDSDEEWVFQYDEDVNNNS